MVDIKTGLHFIPNHQWTDQRIADAYGWEEGYLRRTIGFSITQNDVRVLESLCKAGLEPRGIRCRISITRSAAPNLLILDMPSVAKFIVRYRRMLPTEKACRDFDRAVRDLMARPRRLRKERVQAQEILREAGILENS